ncbi:membrane metalloendopeptidase [Corynebacterium suranareeae]|uniref:Membrane metalloendopeptidase n=1 Tax=Corynebacterium suranareeae TaxID=2506452 RepID=A0A160PTJ6_9CORY|nr:M23 family metallopeptidase [Corynebacterium suranareeae]BAU96361.1 membrane metalloendopeptidase [Corynebacterium suranareeae]
MLVNMRLRLLWIISLSLVFTLSLSPVIAHAYVNPATGQDHAGLILRRFDKPEKNWLPGHRGVDLPLEIGDNVLSSNAGTIAFVGIVVGTPTVSIDHDDGLRTTYQPVHAHLAVGDRVEKGDVIGKLGHPTTAYPGLQWGAKIGEVYINPISLLPRPTIRLKPIY